MKPWQRIAIILSSIGLLGFLFIPMLDLFRSQPSPVASPNADPSQVDNEQLKAAVEGYQKVLEREPNNPVALQGLVQAKLAMNDFQGAKAPMEKLVSIQPENPNFLQVLAQIQLQTNDRQGAINTLEKLAPLLPDDKEIRPIIEALKNPAAIPSPTQTPSNPVPIPPNQP